MTNTDLENKVFNFCKAETENDDAGFGPTLEEIEDATGLEINTLKGVLGSLTKKGCICVDEGFGVPTCYTA